MIKPITPEENYARTVRLQKLYILDGRDDPNHPHRGCFTGLHQKYVTHVGTDVEGTDEA